MKKDIKNLKKEITALNIFATLIFISTILNSTSNLELNLDYFKIISSAALISLIFIVKKELKKKLLNNQK
ncbi:MAG: hypothetical protein ACLS2V_13130 [Clostridium paraputrificum]|uniref:hypothetical protein n=1 Tax=Clostridium sp. TaxID=1506 RepID=UPI0025BD8A19|nr:hypothetical protein [Clostridium sp.]MBS5926169.1 hypothetical protein [Clostridium sp.]